MEVVIDTSSFDQFFNLPIDEIFWQFFVNFGWLIIAIIFLLGARELYLYYIRVQWSKTHKNILLAIDIPKGNAQSPRAVENMFTYLAGAHGSINFFEKWFEGKFQKAFSMEVVSLEGYIQFLIYTPKEFRNLVESAVYSQYPDAELVEVADYTEALPPYLPNTDYDIWGTEFVQAAHFAYPIKCYEEFIHQMGESETFFRDPMASLMDLYASLRPSEQIWLQIILVPTGFEWVKIADEEANKIYGKKPKNSRGPGIILRLLEALGEASELIYSIWGDVDRTKKLEEKPKSMMELTPLEKKKAEAIHLKSSKLGFEAKIRAVYVAKREIMNKPKVASGLVGYMKQFSAMDLNNMKPDVKKTMTKAVYFFMKSRLLAKQRSVYRAYIKRSDSVGCGLGIYNIEELATLWHFPIEASVKSAMIQKATAQKSAAPSSLPMFSEPAMPANSILKMDKGPVNKTEPDKAQINLASASKSATIEPPVDDLTAGKSPDLPDDLPFV